ncbi:hypothetical protein M427DRAFT_296332 [Gonapodya prolifera JEL478]|uniref:Uncharacterized protein n=1 Tax=Gonapodya prolifera (strain JEL478) TaxID=1344416 RepID=A0A139AIS5_GONPJ|nr:hypothetical protein M427DRAFT_296332 [Gonapodya prolifera JEL478]|eukprot:KXS16343.1 hypothetical protein M427DRAFT_296332 [Gonapodya prolifera JEL478]
MIGHFPPSRLGLPLNHHLASYFRKPAMIAKRALRHYQEPILALASEASRKEAYAVDVVRHVLMLTAPYVGYALYINAGHPFHSLVLCEAAHSGSIDVIVSYRSTAPKRLKTFSTEIGVI